MTPEEMAREVVATRHARAVAAFWAGSTARGEATATSDIDLVIVHAELPNAWRDSFPTGGRRCETFVHDPRSLRLFQEQDAERGVPALMHMVAHGVCLIAGPEGARLQREAQAGLAEGPRTWTKAELDRSRYMANDLASDLAGAVDATEMRAIGARLFAQAFDHHRRARGAWSARGKEIVRTLRREEGALGAAFLAAFDSLFRDGDPADVLRLLDEIHAPRGGLLSEWCSDAPPHGDMPRAPGDP